MPPPRRLERLALTALAVAALLALAVLAWRAAGWFGVGVLGLLVLFLSVRAELDGDRAVGSQMTPGLYAEQFRVETEADRSTSAGRRTERRAMISAARQARLFGAALAIAGFGLFLLL